MTKYQMINQALSKLKSYICVKTGIKLFCFVLCIKQIEKICYLYFKYETTTDNKYENELYFSLPAITLCFPKAILLKDEFKQKYSQNSLNKQIYELMNEN